MRGLTFGILVGEREVTEVYVCIPRARSNSVVEAFYSSSPHVKFYEMFMTLDTFISFFRRPTRSDSYTSVGKMGEDKTRPATILRHYCRITNRRREG